MYVRNIHTSTATIEELGQTGEPLEQALTNQHYRYDGPYPKSTQNMNKFKWTIEIEVAETWVADGFDPTEERFKEMVLTDLIYAYDQEVNVTILQRPDPKLIRQAQGYEQ